MNISLTTVTKLIFFVTCLLTFPALTVAQSILPLGIYTTTITAADNPPERFLIATWEQTLLPGNRYRVLRNGAPAIEGTYTATTQEVSFDEGRGPYACTGDGNGTYRWMLDGNKLKLTGISDKCTGRYFVLTLRQLGFISQATTVSAASFRAPVAAEAIVSAFGLNISTATAAADTIPLPTTLAGTQVKLKDAASIEHMAPLFFVSPDQINFQVPAGVAPGIANLTISNGNASTATGTLTITGIAPGLFAANADGQGIVAAIALRVKSDGSQTYELLARFDAAANPAKFVATPLDLGPSTDTVFLLLYGTGLRNRSSLAAVTVSLGGTPAPVEFAGAVAGLTGLDQVNVRLPRSLAGRGEVEILLTVDGVAANAVRMNFK
jgi:uncharacterized protein (TIGR03437 family)